MTAWQKQKLRAENMVLAQIREHGGFTTFWVTDRRDRSEAVARLVKAGRIAHTGGEFPFVSFDIMEDLEP